MHHPTKKRRRTVCKNVDDADTGGSGSLIAPTDINYGGSSSSPIETNNASSSVPAKNSYEVFLNFRGKDIRTSFADHLYNGLVNAGIHAFRDNEEICEGEEIGPNLLEAIKNSKILIPILSMSYATSRWCLKELVQIMKCKKKNMETVVLPIFYKVTPHDVRGCFGDAFHFPSRDFDRKITKKWKQALRQVADLKGWEAKGCDESEVELVKSVVRRVLLELKKRFELVIPKNLTGIDSHVKKVMKFVDKSSCATLFVGIHGMGGIGKTTLAKIIYNKLSKQFEHRSFIADVRESCKVKGIDYLQSKLIFDILKQENKFSSEDVGIMIISSQFKGKKVLILLDDVGEDDELKALAGDQSWFSSGSIIIITTRNKSILDTAGVVCQYGHEEMDRDNSLILFSRHAFRKDSPPNEFEDLAHEVVSTTGGLPLSLEVLGSFLCGKEPKLWRGMINKLKRVPHKKVEKSLKISYEALEDDEKEIFLDIACFFIGTDWRIASYMWEACGFSPEVAIEVLRFLSLVKIGDHHELLMHDHLRDLGRKIVDKENKMEPGKRSRLWDFEEALKVLEENEGTKKIEAIYLSKGTSEGFDETTDQGGNSFTGKQFKKLRNLRFLHARGAHFRGDFKDSMKNLKWLHWEYYPLPFEGNNLHVKELRVLKLWGKISDKWQGWSFITMAKKLKYLNLAYCRSLKGTSFLSAFENLEVLILYGCEKLKQIDSSIGNMSNLECLDLTRCDGLEGLPAEVGKLKKLKQLILHWTFISSLPDSIWALQNLEILDIQAAQIENLPDSIGALQNLKILNIAQTNIKKLPHDIGRLSKVQYLSAANCNELKKEIPEGIYNLSCLQHLDLSFCYNLPSLPVLPSSLEYLSITCQSHRLSSLSNLTHLKKLRLLDCQSLECFGKHPSTLSEKSVNTPFELEILIIARCNSMKTLDVSQFDHLRRLCVKVCKNRLEIRGLNKLKYLESLEIEDCGIERFDLPKFKGLRIFEAKKCVNLVEIQGLNKLKSLEGIDISECTSIVRLDLPKSKGMKIFNVKDCVRLVEIQGLNRCKSLKGIDISGCASIARLDLPKSEGMMIINAKNCKNLVEIQGLDRLESLEEIDIYGCSSIEMLSFPKNEGLKIFGDTNCQNLVNMQAQNSLQRTGYFASSFIQGLGRPMCEDWGTLYGGLYESLYKV